MRTELRSPGWFLPLVWRRGDILSWVTERGDGEWVWKRKKKTAEEGESLSLKGRCFRKRRSVCLLFEFTLCRSELWHFSNAPKCDVQSFTWKHNLSAFNVSGMGCVRPYFEKSFHENLSKSCRSHSEGWVTQFLKSNFPFSLEFVLRNEVIYSQRCHLGNCLFYLMNLYFDIHSK